MSLPFKHLYEFGEFRLDIKEKTLMRGEEHLELTPKGFELLTVLVENHGRLLGKDELMDKIWADSFVEESNLTFNIRQLRIILGDSAQNPKYIKTIRGHGYRFIADVRQISADEKPQDAEPKAESVTPLTSQPEKPVPAEKSAAKKFLFPAFAAFIVLLVGAVVIGSWYARNRNFEPHAPVLSAPFATEKISTNGKVFNAVLSPDGKTVVYTNGKLREKQSVWLRQLDDGSNVPIIPPSDESYFGLALSPDGKLLYFVRQSREKGEQINLYRVSIFGGIPQKITETTEGWISLSPDGSKISFVRCPHRDDENCALWIADSADGGNERKLAARPRPFRIGDNQIAPDGKSVTFAVGQSENSGNEFGLYTVDLESGAESELSKEKFFNIKNLVWLPDKSGLLVTAARVPNKNFRIWQISAATGEASPLTKDSETYSVLSLDREATKIISTQIRPNFTARLFSFENPTVSRDLADASSIDFAPDGKIYFSSILSGNEEIWSINADGSGQRQLTNNPAEESVPVVSPDGNSIFFASNRSGAAQIWRMNSDGSNQSQITQKDGGFPLSVSADGEWIYYHHGINRTLWRVSVKSGAEQIVLNKARSRFTVSPDGTQVAYVERQDEERILAIASLANGQIQKTFHLADRKSHLFTPKWMPDGKNLVYFSATNEFDNFVLWMQPLDADTPRQIVALGNQEPSGYALAISPDGKTFAVVQGEWLHDAVLLKGLQ